MYDPKKSVDWKGVQARYKDMMAELRAQKESDEAPCDHFYRGYCGKYEDGCFHQCEREGRE